MAGGSCPVGPAWQALVNAVGEYEAMKDFMENNETVRTPEEVLDKLESLKNFEPVIEHEMTEEYWKELYTGVSAKYLQNRQEFESIKIPGIKDKFKPDTSNVYHGTNNYQIDSDGNLILIPSLNFR